MEAILVLAVLAVAFINFWLIFALKSQYRLMIKKSLETLDSLKGSSFSNIVPLRVCKITKNRHLKK